MPNFRIYLSSCFLAAILAIGSHLAHGESARLSAPILMAPFDGAEFYMPVPSFLWEPIEEAEGYEIIFGGTAKFTIPSFAGLSVLPRFVRTTAFKPGTYYWQVRAVDRNGSKGPLSPPRKFTVNVPANSVQIRNGASASEIAEIVSWAVKNTPVVVNFAPSGVYRLDPPGFALLTLNHARDVIVNGNGAAITFTRCNASLASLQGGSRDILIRDLSVDYDPVPFTVATIVEAKVPKKPEDAPATFRVRIDPGMPPLDAPHMLSMWTWGVVLDAKNPGRMKTGSPTLINTRRDTLNGANGVFNLELVDGSQFGFLEAGDKYVQFARNGSGAPLLHMHGAENIAVLNVRNHAVSTGHYEMLECSDVKIIGCQSLIKQGRWFGGNADGIHCRANRIGPWVENCIFNGLGDDGAALYSKGIAILQKESEGVLRLDVKFFNLEVGDRFAVFDPKSGELMAKDLIVTAITPISANEGGIKAPCYRVEFSSVIAVNLDPSDGTDADAAQHPQVFNSSKANRLFMLRGNIFRNIRRFGTIIRAKDGAVVENQYEGISEAAIVVSNEPDDWRNGLQSENILIRNNKISDSGFGLHAKQLGQIHVMLKALGGRASPWRAHREIRIENNVISDWNQRGISVQSAEDVVISDNSFGVAARNYPTTEEQYAIFLKNVDDASVMGNRLTHARPSMRLLQALESDVESDKTSKLRGLRGAN